MKTLAVIILDKTDLNLQGYKALKKANDENRKFIPSLVADFQIEPAQLHAADKITFLHEGDHIILKDRFSNDFGVNPGYNVTLNLNGYMEQMKTSFGSLMNSIADSSTFNQRLRAIGASNLAALGITNRTLVPTLH